MMFRLGHGNHRNFRLVIKREAMSLLTAKKVIDNTKIMIKYNILFQVGIEVNTDDYDEGERLAKAEADGMSRVLFANTNYNKFKVKSVNIDLNDRIIEMKQTADDMITALKNIDK